MDRAQINTITDVEMLQQLLAEQCCEADSYEQIIADREHVITPHEQVIACHVQTIVHREARIAALTAEIARLRRVQFGARSEKMDAIWDDAAPTMPPPNHSSGPRAHATSCRWSFAPTIS